MRVLFIGSDRGNNHSRKTALEKNGCDVTVISDNDNTYRPGIDKGPNVFHRISNKVGMPIDKFSINRRVLNMCCEKTFDIVWVEKCLYLKKTTLLTLKKRFKKCIFINISQDDMFAKHNQSLYYNSCLPHYDIIFTTKSYNANNGELASMGAKKVIFINNAYDDNIHYPHILNKKERDKYGGDVGFVGTFEEDRANHILFLAKNGIRVRVWGNGWKKYLNKHENMLVENRPIYGIEYTKSICATKINLGFLRKVNRDLQTSRSVQIPACGGFLLAERTNEHSKLFDEGEEAEFFENGNFEELYRKVNLYLNNNEKRQKIALAGRDKCVAGNYSYYHQVQYALSECLKLQ